MRLSPLELVQKNFEETGRMVHVVSIYNWCRRGLEGMLLPSEGSGGGLRIQWNEFKKWQRAVQKAKEQRRRRPRKKAVPA